ncbi:MAG: HAD family phosphatase [Symploca sp. SIO2B6]|nr:HAD family phosphatase [Symploca sp. SIO2B6]
MLPAKLPTKLSVKSVGFSGMKQNSSQRRMLIFDFDGVVVDTERVHFDSWNAAFEQMYGVTMSGDHTQIVGLSLDQLFVMWQQQGLLPPSKLTNQDKFNFLECKTAHFYRIGATKLAAMAGLSELVQQVRAQGWYVAIASRSRRLRLLKTLELVGITIPFDIILGTEDVVNSSSDRKEHHRAAHIFGIESNHCIVIEDSPSGVADAIASGIGHVIGITTSFNRQSLLDAGAHVVVNALEQVVIL